MYLIAYSIARTQARFDPSTISDWAPLLWLLIPVALSLLMLATGRRWWSALPVVSALVWGAGLMLLLSLISQKYQCHIPANAIVDCTAMDETRAARLSITGIAGVLLFQIPCLLSIVVLLYRRNRGSERT